MSFAHLDARKPAPILRGTHLASVTNPYSTKTVEIDPPGGVVEKAADARDTRYVDGSSLTRARISKILKKIIGGFLGGFLRRYLVIARFIATIIAMSMTMIIAMGIAKSIAMGIARVIAISGRGAGKAAPECYVMRGS